MFLLARVLLIRRCPTGASELIRVLLHETLSVLCYPFLVVSISCYSGVTRMRRDLKSLSAPRALTTQKERKKDVRSIHFHGFRHDVKHMDRSPVTR